MAYLSGDLFYCAMKRAHCLLYCFMHNIFNFFTVAFLNVSLTNMLFLPLVTKTSGRNKHVFNSLGFRCGSVLDLVHVTAFMQAANISEVCWCRKKVARGHGCTSGLILAEFMGLRVQLLSFLVNKYELIYN